MGITKQTHMHVLNDDGNASGPLNHPHAVSCAVSWPLSKEEQDLGTEGEVHQYNILVLPELRLPKSNPTLGQGVEIQYSHKDCCCPFLGNALAGIN